MDRLHNSAGAGRMAKSMRRNEKGDIIGTRHFR